MLELLQKLIDFFLHLDVYLSQIIQTAGGWTYLILALVIFVETGVVAMPFLPGDSLLFAAGAFAAKGDFHLPLLLILLSAAAITGDSVNYAIGHFIGPKVFSRDYRFLKREHLEKTHAFYEKHGGKTIILARFIPIIRTFAPFVAGVGAMTYPKFLAYNIAGGILWVTLFTLAGYFFGNVPFVQKNFEFVIVAIILVSVLPAAYEVLKHRLEQKKAAVELD